MFKKNEGNDYDGKYQVLSILKNEKLKINDILIEKYKDMLEDLDFEQDYYSRTAKGIYKTGHDSIRLTKCLNKYNRSYHDNLN